MQQHELEELFVALAVIAVNDGANPEDLQDALDETATFTDELTGEHVETLRAEGVYNHKLTVKEILSGRLDPGKMDQVSDVILQRAARGHPPGRTVTIGIKGGEDR